MWDALPNLVDKLLSHGRAVFAVFVTSAWLLNRGDEFDFAKPTAYFWIALVFSGSLIVANIAASIYSAIARAMKEGAEHDAMRADNDRLINNLIATIPALDQEQRVTCVYCRLMNLRTFQAWAEDPVLSSLSTLGLLEYGPELTNGNRLYHFYDFVWEHLPTKGLSETELDTVRREAPPWEERRRRGGWRGSY